MRTMLRVRPDIHAGNKALIENKVGEIIGKTIERTKAEAAYFMAENGRRTAYIFFDLKNAADIPAIGEPLYTQLNAEVDFIPCMNQQELAQGIEAWSKGR